jgi:hypothetical protein
VPRIVLQRVEDVFPAVRETMVSVLCLFAQEGIFLSSSLDLQAQRDDMCFAKIVFIFIIDMLNILWMTVGVIAVWHIGY